LLRGAGRAPWFQNRRLVAPQRREEGNFFMCQLPPLPREFLREVPLQSLSHAG
jgi:hypothetical protein